MVLLEHIGIKDNCTGETERAGWAQITINHGEIFGFWAHDSQPLVKKKSSKILLHFVVSVFSPLGEHCYNDKIFKGNIFLCSHWTHKSYEVGACQGPASLPVFAKHKQIEFNFHILWAFEIWAQWYSDHT